MLKKISLVSNADEGGTGGGSGWLANFPEDIRGHEAFSGLDGMKALGSAFIDRTSKLNELNGELETLKNEVGTGIKLPGDNAGMEELANFYAKLGRPETPEGYNLTSDTPLTESGGKLSPEEASMFADMFHKAGLRPEQGHAIASQLAALIEQSNKAEQEAIEKARADATAALQEAWGENAAENNEMAKRTVMKFATAEEMKAMEESGFMDNANFIKVMHRIAATALPDKFMPKGGTPNPGLPKTRDGKTMLDFSASEHHYVKT